MNLNLHSYIGELERHLLGLGMKPDEIRAIRKAHNFVPVEPEPNALSEVLNTVDA